MANSADPDQLVCQIQISWLLKPTDLDLHCLRRQGISGFSRTRLNLISRVMNGIYTLDNRENHSFDIASISCHRELAKEEYLVINFLFYPYIHMMWVLFRSTLVR